MDMNAAQERHVSAAAAVIGSILLEPELAGEVLRQLTEADFPGEYRALYSGIRQLFAACTPIDPVTLAAAVGKAYEPKILEVMQITPTAANCAEYVRLVHDQAMLQRLQQAAIDITSALTLDAATSAAENVAQLLADRPGVEIVSWQQGLADFLLRQGEDQKPDYLSFGMDALDKRLYVSPGDLVVLAGRPSSGKTMLAAQLAYHMARKKRVGIFSLETSGAKVYDRLISHAGQIDFGRVKRHELLQQDYRAVNALGADDKIRLDVIPAVGMSVAQVQAISLSRHYDVIFIDYLQLLRAEGRDRFSQVTNISLQLHQLATGTGITVIALSQLARPEKGSKVKRPTMSELRESGQLEQDADAILMLHRVNPDDNDCPRTLYIDKQKEGELGYIQLDFKPQLMTFVPIKPSSAPAIDAAVAKVKKERRAAQMGLHEIADDEPLPF